MGPVLLAARPVPATAGLRGRPPQRHSRPVLRAAPTVPYGSKDWKAVYNKRVSVERVFSRLKGFRKLNAMRTRRMAKVKLHVVLSLLAMAVSGLVGTDSGDIRRCVA